MTGFAVSAVSGAVALVAAILFVRWLIVTMRADARERATLYLRAATAEANADALRRQLGQETARREALEARYAEVAADALRVGTDADAVELAGGDAGMRLPHVTENHAPVVGSGPLPGGLLDPWPNG